MEDKSEQESQAVIIKVDEGGKGPNLMRSNKIPEDPFKAAYGDGSVVAPPYDLRFLSELPDSSNILPQCIEAMEANVDGYGFTLVTDEPEQENGGYREEVEAERRRIQAFFEYCNLDMPYSQLCRRKRRDQEATGNAYWEVLRNGKGEPCGIEHIESHTMRLTKLDNEYTEIDTPKYVQEATGAPPKMLKRFRRYMQIRDGKRVYFKEWGDPRNINAVDGKVWDGDIAAEAQGKYRPATEVIHFKIYSSGGPYGVPRWIGNLLSVLGSRQAEEVNFEYFENNTVPPLAITVSGRLNEATKEDIRYFFNEHVRGRESFNKILIVQADPAGIPLPGVSQQRPDIRFEHLSDAQHKDALFGEYDRVNREKVRSAFRLPPIYVGLSEDYTRATASESRMVAEEQVFGPERDDFDFVINRRILPAMGCRYWKYKSLSPTPDDSETLAGMLTNFSSAGMTVRELRRVMAEILNKELQEADEKAPWLDMPLAVYLEQLRIAGQPVEQQDGQGKAQPGEKAQKSAYGIIEALKGLRDELSANDGGGCGCHDE